MFSLEMMRQTHIVEEGEKESERNFCLCLPCCNQSSNDSQSEIVDNERYKAKAESIKTEKKRSSCCLCFGKQTEDDDNESVKTEEKEEDENKEKRSFRCCVGKRGDSMTEAESMKAKEAEEDREEKEKGNNFLCWEKGSNDLIEGASVQSEKQEKKRSRFLCCWCGEKRSDDDVSDVEGREVQSETGTATQMKGSKDSLDGASVEGEDMEPRSVDQVDNSDTASGKYFSSFIFIIYLFCFHTYGGPSFVSTSATSSNTISLNERCFK